MNYEGFIPITVGVYTLLMAYKVIPRNPNNSKKWEEWDNRYGKLIKIVAPLLILFGILQLTRVL